MHEKLMTGDAMNLEDIKEYMEWFGGKKGYNYNVNSKLKEIIKNYFGVRVIAQSVKCLPQDHEDVDNIHRHPQQLKPKATPIITTRKSWL